MATRSLNVVISGDARQLGLATKQADKHMDGTGKTAKRMGSALKLGFGAAVAGAGLLVVGLKETIGAAMDAEKSNARLQAQLKASGISYRAHAKEIEAVIQKTSQLAAVDDEDLQDAFTNLVRATGDVNQSMKDLTLVADLARAKNIDVAKAGELVAKVHNGNVGVLKRYGIQVNVNTVEVDALKRKTDSQVDSLRKQAAVATGPAKAALLDRIKDVRAGAAEERLAAKAADKTATAQGAIAKLQNTFKGQAAAYGKTAAGAQERFQVAVENLKEMLGAALLPTVTKVTNAVSKFVNEMQTGTGAGGGFARQMSDVAKSINTVSSATNSVVKWTHKHELAWKSLGEVLPNPLHALQGLTGILKGIVAAGKAVVSVIKSIGGAISDVAGVVKDVGGKLNPFGDGPGRMSIPSIPNFGGGLMGARPSMAPFAAAGARFGLHVSSGLRPGSITSSGNVSYHSSGEAIDMADGTSGPSPAKLGFFRQMKAKFGGRLAELIYTPGGAGIKDGHAYTYGGQVARDHYDHVHVALDTGVPGVGDGLGKFTASAYGPPWGGIQGTGTTATGVDLHNAPHKYGVAVDPKVIPLGSKLKITPNPFGYGGTFEAFDTGGAIKGKRIDFYDWRGRKSQLAWGMKSVTVSTVGGGSSKGAGTKKGGGTHTVTVKPSGPGFEKEPDAPAGLTPEQQAALDFTNKTRGPGKGTGARAPRKGMTAAEAQALGLGQDQGDPNQPLIDAQTKLTEALKDVQKSIDAQVAFASSVVATDNYQLKKYVADILSGHFGQGIVSRSFTPGTGVEVAY